MRNHNIIHVIGVAMFNKDLNSAVKDVIEHVKKSQEKKNLCISATGAHGIIEARKNKSFKELLNGFYMNLPDGMPGVWVGRLKGAKEMGRCYGPDFFAHVMMDSADQPITHFLCGGKPGVAGQLKTTCKKLFNNNKIAGTYCPPFNDVEKFDYRQIADEINKSGADIVWVGLGTPKQEQFARRLSMHTNVHFLITVGAAFDFHIGKVKQAPKWMQKTGLEWFFRLFTEPRRLYKRYLEIVPKFIFYSISDYSSHLLRKKK